MDFKDVLEQLKNNIDTYFAQLNYKAKAKENGFILYKETSFGKEIISLDVANYTTQFNISASFIASSSVVTDLYSKTRDLKEEFDTDFGYVLFAKNKDLDIIHYPFNNKEVLNNWFKSRLLEYYKKYIVAFFKNTNTLDKVDKLLNENPFSNDEYIQDTCDYAQKAIIIAKLNNNPSFKELAEFYYKELEKRGELFEYPDVMSYLKQTSR